MGVDGRSAFLATIAFSRFRQRSSESERALELMLARLGPSLLRPILPHGDAFSSRKAPALPLSHILPSSISLPFMEPPLTASST